MSYVRKKISNGNEYYQLVESRVVGGQPRQKLLLYLGKHETLEDAEAAWSRELENLKRDPDSNGKKEKVAGKLQRLRELRAAGVA